MRNLTVSLVCLAYLSSSLALASPVQDKGEKMHITFTDANGKPIGKGKDVTPPKADRFAKNGLSHIADYARKFVDSKSKGGGLSIISLDGKKSCMIVRRFGKLFLMESIEIVPPSKASKQKEQAIRKFFEGLGIKDVEENVHDYNGVKNAMRVFNAPLKNDAKQVTTVLERYLSEIYHVRKEEGLSFTLQTRGLSID